MKRQATGTSDKPVLDEGAFQQLLSAAFVLQEHKERMQEGGAPDSAFGRVLAQVVEIQEQIRGRKLDLRAAATLVARRLREMTEASGAAVGILEGKDLNYFAATGSASGEVGARAPFDLSLAAECLQTGLVLRCPNAETDTRLRPDLCRPLNIRALIAVPILFEAKVAGVLELHFDQAGAFHDQDVRASQLLAALLAEALAQESGLPPRKSPAQPATETAAPTDTASLRAALEKIKPQLERLSGSAPPPVMAATPIPQANAASSLVTCAGCGRQLAEDQTSCGSCGTSRQTPSTWSTLWDLQRKAEKSGEAQEDFAEDASSEGLKVLPSELEDIIAQFSMEPADARPSRRPQAPVPASASTPPAASGPLPDVARVNGNGGGEKITSLPYTPSAQLPATAMQYSSAASGADSLFPTFAEDSAFPEQEESSPGSELADTDVDAEASYAPWNSKPRTHAAPAQPGGSWLARNWKAQRANIYLAASAALLVAVLFDWNTSPAPPPNAANGASTSGKSARRKAPPKPELSTGEKLLVGLGLAEAPEAPAYTGNPDTKVWIDVHTALYHCPGSDLYGKTTGGRFTSQGDAEQDNFQPASRHACD